MVILKKIKKNEIVVNKNSNLFHAITQPAIRCSKLIIETLEKGVKYDQSQQERYQNDANGIVLVSLLLTLNIFHTLC